MAQRTTQSSQSSRAAFFTPINERFSYDRLQRLGSGTYGTVYLGRDKQGGPVAVKAIERGTASKMKWEAGELVEVAMLRRLSGQHRNMLQFVGCVGSRMTSEMFIFMELCEKGALSKLITRLTELQTFLLFQQLVDGMDFLHRQNILHHDLKPDNLLITATNDLKIADFGTARCSEGGLKSLPKYTPVYTSPEVLFQQKYDEKCDVFSAGYILYEMLAGERLNKQVKNIEAYIQAHRSTGFAINHPAISPRWASLIRTMLDFDPAKRPSFAQLGRTLKDAQAPLDRLPAFRPPSEIEAEQSGRYLERIRKAVLLMEARNNYLVSILRVFHRHQERSLLIPCVYKAALLYLSLSLYCLLSEDALSQLDRKGEFDIEGQSVDEIEEVLTVTDRAHLAAFLKDMRERINFGKQQMKDYLARKVVADIRETAGQASSHPERVVLEELQILEDLQQAEESGRMGVEHFYKGGLARCADNLFRSGEEVERASSADLACYLMVLYVAHASLDCSASGTVPRCQQVLAMGREQLCKEIAVWKSRA